MGMRIPFDKTPKYLRVTLDRTFSYYQHLLSTAAEVSKRYNLLKRLVSNHCGADFTTLHQAEISPLKNGKLKSRMPLTTRMHCLSHDVDNISPEDWAQHAWRGRWENSAQ